MSEEKKYNSLGPKTFWCRATPEQQSELRNLCRANNVNTDGGGWGGLGSDAYSWWTTLAHTGPSVAAAMSAHRTAEIVSFHEFRRRIIEAENNQPKPDTEPSQLSQLSRIKAHLERGESITPIDALNLYGCFRLGARINDLRRLGLPVETEMITSGRAVREIQHEEMKKNDNLETPAWVTDALGAFDTDPCAGPRTTIGRKHNYALERGQDGLELPWEGVVWCNPPYSHKEVWIDKMISHDNGVLILPERGSAPWFGPLAEHCGVYFVLGKKINFIGGPSSNPLGSVLFPFGHAGRARLHLTNLPGHFVEVVKFNPR